MNIQVNDQILLTKIFKKDKPNLVRYINHPEIANNTLTIPYPYQPEDGDFFLNLIRQKEKETGQQFNWAIRHPDKGMIGSIGLIGGVALGNPLRDGFGYWLAEDFWGKGIMTEVVQKFTEYCLGKRGLVRLEATVFAHNIGSMKVLEKTGFEREGILKKAYLKDGQFLDGILYAKIKS